MRSENSVCGDDFAHVLVAVVRVVGGRSSAVPHKRTCRDLFRRIPGIGIAAVVGNLQVAIVNKTLIVLGNSSSHAVIGHIDKGLSV